MVPSTAMRILDVGCSNGALGGSLRASVHGRKVEGIEGSPTLAAEAEKHLDRVICADLNHFSWANNFAAESFDCIIFADVLEHLVDPWQQLKSAAACLRKDGCIIISLPNIRHITSFVSIFIHGTFPRRSRGIFDNTHLRWFTLKDATALIHDAGLKISAIDSSLRFRDQGGGFLNKLTIKAFSPIQNFYPVREFFTYQYCIRAVKV
ncbi:MAG: class I SAM-dependent methyltransferase [Pseudomonadota bacterium]